MLQLLGTIAIVTLLGLALVESAAIDASVAAHQLMARGMRAALDRGTNDAVVFARRFVAEHGAGAAWPPTSVSGETVPFCSAAATDCPASANLAFRVAADSAAETTGTIAVPNVQRALDENRLSAFVTAIVRDRAGYVEGGATRRVTMRLFDAPPYAVVTGVRDASAMAGAAGAGEGDSGGSRSGVAGPPPTPDPAHPARDRDTTIAVTMTCANSAANASADPYADDNAPGNDGTPWGVSGHGFEAPCAPSYPFSATPPIPADAPARASNDYDVGSFGTIRWTTGTADTSSWAE